MDEEEQREREKMLHVIFKGIVAGWEQNRAILVLRQRIAELKSEIKRLREEEEK